MRKYSEKETWPSFMVQNLNPGKKLTAFLKYKWIFSYIFEYYVDVKRNN